MAERLFHRAEYIAHGAETLIRFQHKIPVKVSTYTRTHDFAVFSFFRDDNSNTFVRIEIPYAEIEPITTTKGCNNAARAIVAVVLPLAIEAKP